MRLSRRDICVLLPALMASTSGYSAGKAQDKDRVLKSAIYNFEDMRVEKSGSQDYLPVFAGSTYSGSHIELHESALAPGAVVHGMYSHPGDELFLVREGTLEVEFNGTRSQVGSGSVAYIASNTEYAIRNTSKQWTRYFVLLFGPPHPPIHWGATRR